MSSTRKAAAVDWTCRFSKDQDGKPFVNFCNRRACLRCHIDKGACHLSSMAQSPPKKVQPTLAERQVEHQKKDAKIDIQMEKLKRQLEETQKAAASVSQSTAGREASSAAGCSGSGPRRVDIRRDSRPFFGAAATAAVAGAGSGEGGAGCGEIACTAACCTGISAL